jgi:hypothetical protein
VNAKAIALSAGLSERELKIDPTTIAVQSVDSYRVDDGTDVIVSGSRVER